MTNFVCPHCKYEENKEEIRQHQTEYYKENSAKVMEQQREALKDMFPEMWLVFAGQRIS